MELHTALNMFYMILEKAHRHEKLEKKKKSQKLNIEPTFFGDRYIIGTAKAVCYYWLFYCNRDR